MPLGIAISMVSAAALGYEVVLIRLYSIIQWHHFAAMIISLALLGYGASGTVLALGRRWVDDRFAIALPVAAALFGATAMIGFAVAQRIPFNPLALAWDLRQPAFLALAYVTLAVPFLFAGGFVGMALYRFRAEAGRIYRFDLIGAGLGGPGAIAALFLLDPADCLRLISGLGLAAAALLCSDGTLRLPRRVTVALAALAVALPFAVPGDWLAPRLSPYKSLSQALRVPDTAIIDQRFNPLGWVTVIASPTVPFRHAPGLSFNNVGELPEQIAVFTDGDGPDIITRFDGDFGRLAYLDYQTSALPYHLSEAPTVLVLGAAGGESVLRALYHRARRIDAVELNPQLVALVRHDFSAFAGNVYERDEVRVHVAEARAFVAASDERYDIVALAMPGIAMQPVSTTTLYTVEAVADYLARLAPGGMLAVTLPLKLPPRDNLKLAATAIAALERRGVDDSGRRFALIRGWDTTTLIVRNGDLSAADMASVRAFCAARSFDVAYLPDMDASEANRLNVLPQPYFFQGMTALLDDDRQAFLDGYKFHIRPATDNRPYFFRFFKWRTLPELSALRGRGGNMLIEWGYLVLVLTLAQAMVASLVLILLPLRALPSSGRWGAEGARTLVYFIALGLGFLFIEIAFIHRFTLFLGHPLYAVAVVLSAFLVFAGLGSGTTRRLMDRVAVERAIGLAAGGIALVAVIYLALLPDLLDILRPFSSAVRVAAAAALIAPLGFCMGMPFPLGLARIEARTPGWIPWAWAINGCASVIGAVLAAILAIHFGFAAVIGFAVALYLLAAGVFGQRLPTATP